MEKKKRRIEKKRRRSRTARRIRSLFILAAFIAGVILFLFKAPLFDIENFYVTGNKQLSDNEIVNSSNVFRGENIFRLDKDSAVSSLKKLPYVDSAEVSRDFPDTVRIKIKEKNDIYTISRGNSLLYIGKDAQPLMIVDKNKEAAAGAEDKSKKKKGYIPELKGLVIEEPQIMKTLRYSNKEIDKNQLMEFTNGLERKNIRPAVKSIEITKDSQIVIKTKDYQTIKLGKFRDMEYKMKLLDKILEDLEKKKVKFYIIDFTKSKRVVVQKMTEKDREKIKEEIEAEKNAEAGDNADEAKNEDKNVGTAEVVTKDQEQQESQGPETQGMGETEAGEEKEVNSDSGAQNQGDNSTDSGSEGSSDASETQGSEQTGENGNNNESDGQ